MSDSFNIESSLISSARSRWVSDQRIQSLLTGQPEKAVPDDSLLIDYYPPLDAELRQAISNELSNASDSGSTTSNDSGASNKNTSSVASSDPSASSASPRNASGTPAINILA